MGHIGLYLAISGYRLGSARVGSIYRVNFWVNFWVKKSLKIGSKFGSKIGSFFGQKIGSKIGKKSSKILSDFSEILVKIGKKSGSV